MKKYSIEKNVQIIISLMKAHGIKRVIASPGSTNICLVFSLQNDSYFDVYSSVDERSAAYMACGMAAESGEPVAITCTEATASRNYLPGLTEAFYRKLPVLAITATNESTHVGQNYPQMIDRSVLPKDVAMKSIHIPFLEDNQKKFNGYVNLINDAMTELTRHGGGPVHIEFETKYSGDYSVQDLPNINVTHRIMADETFPELQSGNIAIYVGAHKRWTRKLVDAVDSFCQKYDAVVLCDQIANYPGNNGIYHTILTCQMEYFYPCAQIDTMIYIGEVSSAYEKRLKVNNVWRVSPDGEFRNMLQKYGGKLKYVFEMEEDVFFSHYTSLNNEIKPTRYLNEWRDYLKEIMPQVPELPFSNLWIAQQLAPKLPQNSRLYLSVENSLRSWNFFETDKNIESYCNTGGFGIDGGLSAIVGASIVRQDKLFFFVTGDLAFFYDMNVMGNRHIGNNVRILLINNGIGQQFKNPGHAAYSMGDEANPYVAAAGHWGNKSALLVKHYSEDLGFKYLSANSKEEFNDVYSQFVDESVEKRILFEVFTDTKNETDALIRIQSIKESNLSGIKSTIKTALGDKGVNLVKKILNQ